MMVGKKGPEFSVSGFFLTSANDVTPFAERNWMSLSSISAVDDGNRKMLHRI